MADPSYTLELKQALTIKPKDFYIKAIPRNRQRLYSTPTPSVTLQTHQTTDQTTDKVIDNSKRLYVLYGSNTGTCESFAQRVVDDAPSHGNHSATVDHLSAHPFLQGINLTSVLWIRRRITYPQTDPCSS